MIKDKETSCIYDAFNWKQHNTWNELLLSNKGRARGHGIQQFLVLFCPERAHLSHQRSRDDIIPLASDTSRGRLSTWSAPPPPSSMQGLACPVPPLQWKRTPALGGLNARGTSSLRSYLSPGPASHTRRGPLWREARTRWGRAWLRLTPAPAHRAHAFRFRFPYLAPAS